MKFSCNDILRNLINLRYYVDIVFYMYIHLFPRRSWGFTNKLSRMVEKNNNDLGIEFNFCLPMYKEPDAAYCTGDYYAATIARGDQGKGEYAC